MKINGTLYTFTALARGHYEIRRNGVPVAECLGSRTDASAMARQIERERTAQS